MRYEVWGMGAGDGYRGMGIRGWGLDRHLLLQPTGVASRATAASLKAVP